jgi:hypothetical protein
MSYLLNDNINLDTIFKSLTAGNSDTTNYKSDNKDFNDLYQPLGTYSNLKYWTDTNYKVSSTDLTDIFEFKLINSTDNTTSYGVNYITFPIDNGVLIYINNTSSSGTMTFNSTNQFNVDVIVCAGGGGGGGAANSGNAGGGGGGGGLAHFKLTQPDTSFDTIKFEIGSGGNFATGNDSDVVAGSGGDTTFAMYQDGNELLSCNVSGGGGGGNGKRNGTDGGAGGGAGSYSSGSTTAGEGIVPKITDVSGNDMTEDTVIGYSNIQNSQETSGGEGQDNNNDNGGGGGGGGALDDGVVGGPNSSTNKTKGAGGKGYEYTVYNSNASLNLYLSYGGGGGASYSSQPAKPNDGNYHGGGIGGYGTTGIQQGTAASNAITTDGLFTTIYAGSGGGGNGNNGNSSVFGIGNGANGIIVLIFTNK